MKNYGRFTLALAIVWFVLALSASALHLFQNNANRIGLTIAFAALLPIAVFALWFALSTSFRLFTMSLNPVLLTAAQSSRILGFVFVLAEARGALPALFALPAGYGDMFIGITAAFAAWQLATPQHRISFIFWQFLGITDLVTAVSLGVTSGFLVPYGPSTAPMTTLPLSLIPTFFVPLYLILHIICIAQAKSWQPASLSERHAIRPLQHRPV